MRDHLATGSGKELQSWASALGLLQRCSPPPPLRIALKACAGVVLTCTARTCEVSLGTGGGAPSYSCTLKGVPGGGGGGAFVFEHRPLVRPQRSTAQSTEHRHPRPHCLETAGGIPRRRG